MSSTDESAPSMADTDINSTDADGTNVPGHERDSAAAQGSGDDADRGNLDGSNPVAEPRDRSLDQAGGNGSFDDGSQEPTDGAASDTSTPGRTTA